VLAVIFFFSLVYFGINVYKQVTETMCRFPFMVVYIGALETGSTEG
jgi:hypothetical protein